ncbi:MAG: MFS transporter [Muribaculaceae bacterium]|nr:MFS transporter [Muribaculaceae bacterium]
MKTDYSKKKVFIAACIGIAIFGVVMLSLGAVMTPLTEILPSAISLPQYMSIGIIIGTLIFGPIVDKFGYKWLLISASLCVLIGLLGLASLTEIHLLIASIIIFGIGGGILNGETSALVSDIFDDNKRGRMMSIMSSFYCIGALLWTLSCVFISNYIIPLTIASLLIVAFIIYSAFIDYPKAKPQEKISYIESIKLLRYPILLYFAFFLFFQSGLEAISGNYTVIFLTDNGIAKSIATVALTMFTLGMLIGRLALSGLMAKVKDLYLLSAYLLIALIGSLLMNICEYSIFIPYISMLLIGFGAGASYPIMLSRLGAIFKDKVGSAFSATIFIALCGNYSLNFITSKAFQYDEQTLFPVFLAGAIIMMFIILPIAIKATRKK